MYEVTGHDSVIFFFPECVSTLVNRSMLVALVENTTIKVDLCIKQTADYTATDFSYLLVILSRQKAIHTLQLCQLTFESFNAQLLVSLASRSHPIPAVTFVGCTFVKYIHYCGSMRNLYKVLIFRGCKIALDSRYDLVTFLLGTDPSTRFIFENQVCTIADAQKSLEKCETVD
jgi:hypothetical protein